VPPMIDEPVAGTDENATCTSLIKPSVFE
jgi:hypothetical protein